MVVERDGSKYVSLDQEQYEKCFVCYLDILGFKRLVIEHEPNTLNFLLKSLHGNWDVLTRSLSNATSLVQTAILVSDSFLLFTKNDSSEDFKYLVGNVAQAMTASQVPLRGAISHGDFYFDNKLGIFFGPALVDATEYEKKQEWIGVVLTPTCSQAVATKNYRLTDLPLIEYDVPVKKFSIVKDERETDNAERLQCLRWKRADLEQAFPLSKPKDGNPMHLRKFKNTQNFLNHLKERESTQQEN